MSLPSDFERTLIYHLVSYRIGQLTVSCDNILASHVPRGGIEGLWVEKDLMNGDDSVVTMNVDNRVSIERKCEVIKKHVSKVIWQKAAWPFCLHLAAANAFVCRVRRAGTFTRSGRRTMH